SMNASSLTMRVPPPSSEPRLVFRAAGFMATSTFGRSPGVVMSRLAKWIWNADTPASVPAGARTSAREPGSAAAALPRTPGVAGPRCGAREPVAGQRHAVARVGGEPNDDALPLFDGLRSHQQPGPPGARARPPPRW